MTHAEMSNEFDILYNNITSNQAPSLDEYEKSVFLTKAQDDIIKNYMDPKLNRSSLGIDDSSKRQIDFSNIINIKTYTKSPEYNSNDSTEEAFNGNVQFENTQENGKDSNARENLEGYQKEFVQGTTDGIAYIADSFLGNGNVRIKLPDNIFYILNERVVISRALNGDDSHLIRKILTVVPITSDEWDRICSKPYKRPAKNQSWRLLIGSIGNSNNAELVLSPNDIFIEYVIRYVKQPTPIILTSLSDEELSINGYSEPMDCELDPSIHEDIVQRAVELAKAAYTENLSTQVQLGKASQTNIGINNNAGYADGYQQSYNPYAQS